MTPNAAPANTKSYALSSAPPEAHPPGILASLGRLLPLMATEQQQRHDRLCRRRRVVARRAGRAAHHRAHDRHLHRRPATSAACCASAALLLVIYARGVRRHLRPDADHGQRRPARAVRAAEHALHEAAAAAARLLQPEQGRRSDLAHQQRHRQAEPVLRAEPGPAGRQSLHDGRRGRLSRRAQRPPRPRGAGAGHRRLPRDAPDRPVGTAQERQEPAVARRSERGDPGEPGQLQGHRRVQPPRLLPAKVRRGQRAHVLRVGRLGARQQRVPARLRPRATTSRRSWSCSTACISIAAGSSRSVCSSAS